MRIIYGLIVSACSLALAGSGCASSSANSSPPAHTAPAAAFATASAITSPSDDQAALRTVKALLKERGFPQAAGFSSLQSSTRQAPATIGGKSGTTEVTYQVEIGKDPKKDGALILELTKDWHLNVNGKQAVSYWKYGIEDGKAKLLIERDNDSAVSAIK